jgi:L-alanine-DL-glutamate epimerase-like enolase superfamily enzyme
MRLRVAQLALTLRTPLLTSYGTIGERTLLRVELDAGDGRVGAGEAAPLEDYDGVPLATVARALELYAELVADWDGRDASGLLERCRAAAPVPHALAALDVALWDLAGQREGRPIAALLADEPLARVAVNATLGAEEPGRAAEQAAAAVAEGFRCVKVKAGVGDDHARLSAVRDAIGPASLLRADANGAWTESQARSELARLAPLRLELAEEPVRGVAALRALRETAEVPVAMDETASEPGALASGAADAVSLKLARCGGISGLLAAAALVRASGAEPYVSSLLDGPVGIAAAAHAAAAIVPRHACGLATLALFADEQPAPLVRDGAIEVPRAPGLGLASA